METFLKALENEAEYRGKDVLWSNNIFNTIFLGGGTPTCLTVNQFNGVFSFIYKHFKIDPNAEITIEANPETVTASKLQHLKQLGVNRLSLGVQSFSDEILQHLGRHHTANQAVRAINIAQEVGFENINLDLMFGVPKQSELNWTKTLGLATSLEPKHISIYGLTIEPGTTFSLMNNEGRLELPNEELHIASFYQAKAQLGKRGYQHYEVSNFSKLGFECVHNMSIWNGGNYLGLGPSAHSHINGRRMANTRNLSDYLSMIKCRRDAIELEEKLSIDELIHEYILLNLRVIRGLNPAVFQERYGIGALEKRKPAIRFLIENGLLIEEETQLCLTRKGLALADSVCEHLM